MGEKRVNQNCKAGAGVYFGARCRAGERGVTDQECRTQEVLAAEMGTALMQITEAA